MNNDYCCAESQMTVRLAQAKQGGGLAEAIEE